ncbi:MAG: hypothetical protein RLZZ574_2632 [Cyanobacteriota bacterium]|jgi:hypothetical protein
MRLGFLAIRSTPDRSIAFKNLAGKLLNITTMIVLENVDTENWIIES